MAIDVKKISIYIYEFSFLFLMLQQNIFPSELTGVTLLISVVAGVCLFSADRKVFYNPFLVSYGFFIIYVLITVSLGYGEGDILTRVLLIVLKFLSSVGIYNYFMKIDNMESFIKKYIIVSVVSLLVIFFLVGDRAVISRLGHNGSGAIVSYFIGNVPIYKSSNSTANFCAISMFFSIYYYIKTKKSYYLLFCIFLFTGVLLTGSRKGMITSLIFIFYSVFVYKSGVNLKKLFFLFLVPSVLYIVLFHNEYIYGVMGVRIESFVLNLLGDENSLDGNSFLVRDTIKENAYNWILASPLIGRGINSFQTEMEIGAENNYLQILLEFGLVGLFLYYSYLPFLIENLFKEKSELMMISTVVVIPILIQDYGSVTYLWQSMTMWYLFFWAVYERNKLKKRSLTIKY